MSNNFYPYYTLFFFCKESKIIKTVEIKTIICSINFGLPKTKRYTETEKDTKDSDQSSEGNGPPIPTLEERFTSRLDKLDRSNMTVTEGRMGHPSQGVAEPVSADAYYAFQGLRYIVFLQ